MASSKSDGTWSIAIGLLFLLIFMCWKQAGWDQDADTEEYSPTRDCYVVKATGKPAAETNKLVRLRCK